MLKMNHSIKKNERFILIVDNKDVWTMCLSRKSPDKTNTRPIRTSTVKFRKKIWIEFF